MLRCKEGDLAISVNPMATGGQICTVIRRVYEGETDSYRHYIIPNDSEGAAWLVEFHNPTLFHITFFYDKYLRPLAGMGILNKVDKAAYA